MGSGSGKFQLRPQPCITTRSEVHAASRRSDHFERDEGDLMGEGLFAGGVGVALAFEVAEGAAFAVGSAVSTVGGVGCAVGGVSVGASCTPSTLSRSGCRTGASRQK